MEKELINPPKKECLMGSKTMPLPGQYYLQNLYNLTSENFQMKTTNTFFPLHRRDLGVRSWIICSPWHNTLIQSKSCHQMT